MAKIVHALLHGWPLCEFSKDVPAKWPEGHVWTDVENVNDISCLSCREEAKKFVANLEKTRKPRM